MAHLHQYISSQYLTSYLHACHTLRGTLISTDPTSGPDLKFPLKLHPSPLYCNCTVVSTTLAILTFYGIKPSYSIDVRTHKNPTRANKVRGSRARIPEHEQPRTRTVQKSEMLGSTITKCFGGLIILMGMCCVAEGNRCEGKNNTECLERLTSELTILYL